MSLIDQIRIAQRNVAEDVVIASIPSELRVKSMPELIHQPFRVMAQGQHDHTLEAFPITSEQHGVMLTIATPNAAVYVTRDQAAKFFGFVAS